MLQLSVGTRQPVCLRGPFKSCSPDPWTKCSRRGIPGVLRVATEVDALDYEIRPNGEGRFSGYGNIIFFFFRRMVYMVTDFCKLRSGEKVCRIFVFLIFEEMYWMMNVGLVNLVMLLVNLLELRKEYITRFE